MKKQGVWVLILFSLLFAVAVLPAVMFHYSENRLNGIAHVTEVETKLALEYQTPQNYDALERIGTTQKALEQDGNVIVDWKSEVMSEQLQRQLIQTVENQLSILQEMNALPKISISGQYHATFIKRAYMDMQSLNDPINIWNIYISCSDLFVNVCMDAETSMLYKVSVFSEAQDLSYPNGEPSAKGFLKYLQSGSAEIQKGDEVFDTDGYFSVKSAKIYVRSHNRMTGRMTYYNFEGDSDYVLITERGASTLFGNSAKPNVKP